MLGYKVEKGVTILAWEQLTQIYYDFESENGRTSTGNTWAPSTLSSSLVARISDLTEANPKLSFSNTDIVTFRSFGGLDLTSSYGYGKWLKYTLKYGGISRHGGSIKIDVSVSGRIKILFEVGNEHSIILLDIPTHDGYFSFAFLRNKVEQKAAIAIMYQNYQHDGEAYIAGVNLVPTIEEMWQAIKWADATSQPFFWETVPSILGNGKTYSLAKIASARINNGASVTGATSSNFETLTDASLASVLINDVIPFYYDKVIVHYMIPSATYSYIKLVYKKGSIPTTYSDGTAIDILQTDTESEISGIIDGDTYYFVIFTDKSTSEPKPFKTVPVLPDIVLLNSTTVNDYIAINKWGDSHHFSSWDEYTAPSRIQFDFNWVNNYIGYTSISSMEESHNLIALLNPFSVGRYKYLVVKAEIGVQKYNWGYANLLITLFDAPVPRNTNREYHSTIYNGPGTKFSNTGNSSVTLTQKINLEEIGIEYPYIYIWSENLTMFKIKEITLSDV